MEFTAKAGPKIMAYLERIADTMVSLQSIPREEAVGRINRAFKDTKFRKGDKRPDLIFHETPEYWAKTIYYGKDSRWWVGEEGLEPLPYP
jgi:hypothetical protein